MKYLFFLGHPAHFHLFKYTIEKLKKDGHIVYTIIKKKDILEDLYHVLVMTVNPGFGGQSFIPHSLEKVREMKKMILRTGKEILIEVDGGITLENAPALVEAGADVLVAGSSIFQSKDPKETIRLLKRIA